MRRLSWAMFALLALALVATPALAQQTTGNITGQIVDGQGAAVPGVTVTGKNAATGFTRSDVSDVQGIYRLTALPIGTYAPHRGTRGVPEGREQGYRGQRRPDAHARDDSAAGVRVGKRHGHG